MTSDLKSSASETVILGDVGGTNCRLANCEPVTGVITDINTFPVEKLESLEEAIHRFVNIYPSNIYTTAAISIANPITSDRITMTNAHWDFSIEQTRKNTGLDELVMLNDWESVALSLPVLKSSELIHINSHHRNDSGNRALCGVGTGLGAAGLIRRKESGWVPVAGEGGHASFAPIDQEETQILQILRETHEHVSFEKMLSGAGLVTLYRAIAKTHGSLVETLTPQDIVGHAASQSDHICSQTIDSFCGILGSFAGNLCLTFGATGGIYIGGGVVQKIYGAGVFNEEIFLSRLTQKGRLSDWLNNIPAYLLKTPFAGLIGSAAALGVNHAWVSVKPTDYHP
jgi:glucokinase